MIDLDTPESRAFIEFLQECGYSCILPMPDGRYTCLMPLMYTSSIITGYWFDRHGVEQRWCYKTGTDAMVAILNWAVANFEDEPQGWLRHPTTGRRRPDGDKDKEFINP